MGHDVIVIGAGAIGLSIARSLARQRSVLVLERGSPGKESSWAAAGMLCPYSEADGDGVFMRLGMESLGMYRRFAQDLQDETGIGIEYRDDGALVVAATTDEWSALRRQFDWQRSAGFDTELLNPGEVRALEPDLTMDLLGGVFYSGDHQVRPRLLLEALIRACSLRGVTRRDGVPVECVVEEKGRVQGVRAAGGQFFPAPLVVVCAGAWASGIEGLVPEIEVRPRKGQILSLSMPTEAFRHLIRWNRLYFVPRVDGELVIGATNEDCGFSRSLTAGGVGGLLRDAERLSARVVDFPLRETWTGLRPALPDGLPAIGQAGISGLFYALGHYRNGILLAPLTAALIETLILGRETSSWGSAFDPMRFADVRSHARSGS